MFIIMDLDLLEQQLQLEDHYIDIRTMQRNGRKYITIIEGLSTDIELLKQYAKELRKLLNSSCSVDGIMLKLSGSDCITITNYIKKKLPFVKIRINGILQE